MHLVLCRSISHIVLCLGMCIATVAEAQSLLSVFSRKTHATAGDHDLAIDLSQTVSSGALTIEPRAIGSGHLLVFRFDGPIGAAGSAAAFDSAGSPIGMAVPVASGSDVLVTLTGIVDNTRVRVALSGVNGAISAEASLGFLVADFNNTRGVDSVDVAAVKVRTGKAVDTSSFKYDIGATGMVASSDIAAAKARVGRLLPGAGEASLSVARAGTGAGSVVSTPSGINCPSACSANFTFGTNVSLQATPSVGSTFTQWTGHCGGTALTSAVTLNATSSCIASFAINSYAVTPSAGSNGSISPSSVQMVSHGGTALFSLTPNANYVGVFGGTCGGVQTGNSYITNAVTAPCTVTAAFSLASFLVSPSAGPDGVINPSSPQMVMPGAAATFTVTPNANFMATVGGSCGGTLTGNTYTTNPINAACSVQANFTRVMYNVTPTAGANGTISPSTVQSVPYGSTATFSVTPSAGFTAVVSGTCGGSLNGSIYTTLPITGICAVNATFTSNKVIYVATTGNDTSGTGSSSAPYKTISKGISKLASGDTLIVRAGIYTGKANFITGVPAGTPGKYTIVMAETPMDVRIQSTTNLNYSDYQVALSSSYVKVDGFVFDMSVSAYPPHIGSVFGNFNKITRSIFKRSGDIDAYGGLLLVTGSNNLFEDLAGVGACRYCFEQGGPEDVTKFNIWRRVVGRLDYSNSDQPKRTLTTYGNDSGTGVSDHLYQNVIAIDGNDVDTGRSGAEPKYSAMGIGKQSTNVTFQGAIVLNEKVTYAGIFASVTGTGNKVFNSIVWNVGGAGVPDIAGVRADKADTVVSQMTIGGVPALGDYYLLQFNPVTPPNSKLGGTPANIVNNTPGAVVMKRYGVSGTLWGEPGYDQLTTEDLWPWPYQDKIKAVFREVNNVPPGNLPASNNTTRGFAATGNGLYGGPITLTSYIWEITGTPCPPAICQ